ncbi:hypothetical protein OIU85_017158 [Salix viminalis]|uniref:Uncharacterized protein n=1 Tax=Salix viminalis TaxID=40686 RepID=A0A9Q0ZQK1_SALVM|nr:hypothetical protein OIU85_017158 [Salix viminalis]
MKGKGKLRQSNMFIRVILKSTTLVLPAHHVYRGAALLPRNHPHWCSATNQTVPQYGIEGMSANGRKIRQWLLEMKSISPRSLFEVVL